MSIPLYSRDWRSTQIRQLQRWCAVCLFIAASQSLDAQFLACELNGLSRAGGQAGSSFEVGVTSGINVDELTSLVFSHPGITATPVEAPSLPFSEAKRVAPGRFSVTIAADVPPGRYEVRATGRHGVSNPRAFIVSSAEFQLLGSVGHAFDAGTTLAINTLTQCAATATQVDFFRFNAAKSQAYEIELLAQQIDSRLIGQLVLYDPSGRKIALQRGADDTDPTIEFVAESDGEYGLAIHDFTYRGGGEYFYQVIVRKGDNVAPLIPNLPMARRYVSARAMTVDRNVRMTPDPPISATADAPQAIAIPTACVRWFPDDHQDTVFQFSAAKDQVLAFEVISHRVGEPTDARLMVQRVDGKTDADIKLTTVLNVDDGQSVSDGAIQLVTKDAIGLLKVPETADYRLTVRDLDVGRSLRDRQMFQLEVREAEPRFDLVAYRPYPTKDVRSSKPHGSKLFRGGTESVRVMAIRRDGWTGPIQLSVEDLPKGVRASGAVIAANQTQTQITLTADEDAPRSLQPIRIVGRSSDGNLEDTADTATITWGVGAGRDYVRSRLTEQLMIAVSERDVAPLSIQLGDDKLLEVKKGQAVSLPVRVVRREGGKSNITLRARDLPPGAKGGDITIAADKTEGAFQINLGGAPPGTYSLWLQAETKIKVKPNPQALARAQAYRDELQKRHDDPAQAEQLAAIKAAIADADKAIEAAKPLAAERELTVYIPTTNATLRVVEP